MMCPPKGQEMSLENIEFDKRVIDSVSQLPKSTVELRLICLVIETSRERKLELQQNLLFFLSFLNVSF